MTLLVATFVASGCAGVSDVLPNENSDESEPEQLPGRGLEVNSFTISDETLSPGQTAEVTLEMQNYHREDLDLDEIQLVNTGLLEPSEKQCSPDEEDLERATEDLNPIIECTWSVDAPNEEDIGGFSQRSASMTADIEYETAIENYQPLEVEFTDLESIESTDERTISFSNGEAEVEASVESPVAFGEEKTLSYNIRRAGDGRLEDTMEFEYSPVEVFDLNGDESVSGDDGECPAEDDIVLGSGLDFECGISLEGSGTETRNLYFTAYYKYVQSPSLSITIVNE